MSTKSRQGGIPASLVECAWSKCRKPFKKTRRWQRFHDGACRVAYWRELHVGDNAHLKSRVASLESEISSLRELVAQERGDHGRG